MRVLCPIVSISAVPLIAHSKEENRSNLGQLIQQSAPNILFTKPLLHRIFYLIVDGSWSAWGTWSECTATCAPGGTQIRYKECNNPAPAYGGLNCAGDNFVSQTCNQQSCPGISETFFLMFNSGTWSSYLMDFLKLGIM